MHEVLVDDVPIDGLHSSTHPYTQSLLNSHTLPDLREERTEQTAPC